VTLVCDGRGDRPAKQGRLASLYASQVSARLNLWWSHEQRKFRARFRALTATNHPACQVGNGGGDLLRRSQVRKQEAASDAAVRKLQEGNCSSDRRPQCREKEARLVSGRQGTGGQRRRVSLGMLVFVSSAGPAGSAASAGSQGLPLLPRPPRPPCDPLTPAHLTSVPLPLGVGSWRQTIAVLGSLRLRFLIIRGHS